jgi:hypothetical protein
VKKIFGFLLQVKRCPLQFLTFVVPDPDVIPFLSVLFEMTIGLFFRLEGLGFFPAELDEKCSIILGMNLS